MNKVHNLLPEKIEGTFDEPKIFEIVKVTSENHVLQFIETELARLSSLVSVGGNLTAGMIQATAKGLLELFPNETLADFKLCFKRAVIGQYGDIFRLDGIVVRKWMEMYLDEKYQVLEERLVKEKDNMYQKHTHPDSDIDWLEIWKAELDKSDDPKKPQRFTKIREITDSEIQEEGEVKPKRTNYPSLQESLYIQKELHHKWIKACFDPYTAKPNENWMPEDEWIEKQNKES